MCSDRRCCGSIGEIVVTRERFIFENSWSNPIFSIVAPPTTTTTDNEKTAGNKQISSGNGLHFKGRRAYLREVERQREDRLRGQDQQRRIRDTLVEQQLLRAPTRCGGRRTNNSF